jgi:elongation factor 2
LLGDSQVAPEKGTVAFGSGLHGWGFNIERFAKIYAAKMGVDRDKMMKRMWGDSCLNAKKKTGTNVMKPEGCTEPLQHAVCQFIMGPIAQLMRAIVNHDKPKYEKMMTTLGVTLKGDDRQLTGKPLMKRTMQIWFDAADTLLSMIVSKLPSPVVAQKYRVENLYEGPMDDTAANAMRACDPKCLLMMYMFRSLHMCCD